MELDIHEWTGMNSLRRPKIETLGAIDLRRRAVELVEVVPLDDVWQDVIPTEGRLLLKTDVQGFDLEVLKGAENTLDRCVALHVEVSGLPLYVGSPPLLEVVTYLFDRSFRITGLFPLWRSPVDGLQVIDFDATFVRVPVEGAAISVE